MKSVTNAGGWTLVFSLLGNGVSTASLKLGTYIGPSATASSTPARRSGAALANLRVARSADTH